MPDDVVDVKISLDGSDVSMLGTEPDFVQGMDCFKQSVAISVHGSPHTLAMIKSSIANQHLNMSLLEHQLDIIHPEIRAGSVKVQKVPDSSKLAIICRLKEEPKEDITIFIEEVIRG